MNTPNQEPSDESLRVAIEACNLTWSGLEQIFDDNPQLIAVAEVKRGDRSVRFERAERRDPDSGTSWVISREDGVVTRLDEHESPVEGVGGKKIEYRFTERGLVRYEVPYAEYNAAAQEVVDEAMETPEGVDISDEERDSRFGSVLGRLIRRALEGDALDRSLSEEVVPAEAQQTLLDQVRAATPVPLLHT